MKRSRPLSFSRGFSPSKEKSTVEERRAVKAAAKRAARLAAVAAVKDVW
jgi:hypothetical protein